MHKSLYYITAILFLFTACREDEYELNVEEKDPVTITSFNSGDLAGLIMDVDGQAIPNATISIRDKMSLSDDNGYFKFLNIELASSGSLLTVEKEGYFTNYKFALVSNEAKSYLRVTLTEASVLETIASSTGGEINVGGGAKIKLNANSIHKKDGTPYSGDINVKAHWFQPDDPNLSAMMPGDLRGLSLDGLTQQLASYGMMAVELESPQGEELNIIDGQTATLSFPLSDALLSIAPESIPTWSLNEDTGFWEEEATATKVGNSYEAEVSHFSFWNCDDLFPLVELKGRVVDDSNLAIPNYLIEIFVESLLLTANSTTNSEGAFRGFVPQGEPLTLTVKLCGEILLKQDLGILQSDTDLGDLTITGTDFFRRVSGRLLDCQNMPLVNGYAIVENNYFGELLIPDQNGRISGVISNCVDTEELLLTAYDPVNTNKTEALVIPEGDNPLDLGDILVCIDVQESITYRFYNSSTTNLLEDGALYLVNDEFIYLNAFNSNLRFRVDIPYGGTFPLEETGMNDFVSGIVDNGDFVGGSCTGTGQSCEGLQYSINGIAEVGERLEASYSGSLGNAAGEAVQVDGNFNLSIDKIFNTAIVEGQVWYDENENGIREPGEAPVPNMQFGVYNISGSLPSKILLPGETDYIATTDSEGKYKLTGLIPGEEYAINTSIDELGPILTQANVGDDSTDSDFEEDNFDVGVFSHSFIPSDGEVIQNIDLGLINLPLNCSTTVWSCPPNARVELVISGGTPPYTVAFLNDVATINNNTFSVENLSPGVYQFVVSDQSGLETSCEAIISEFKSKISGQAWLDNPTLGMINSKDDNDSYFLDYQVELHEETGVTPYTAVRDGILPSYSFTDLPPGKYRVKVILPTGYSLVESSVGTAETDSDIDPVTGFSEIIEIVDCDEFIYIDIGVKE